MKIVYIAQYDAYGSSGVKKKIEDQVYEWRKVGNIVKIFSFGKRRQIGVDSSSYVALRFFEYFYWEDTKIFISELKAFEPDIIYLRFELYRSYHKQLRRIAPIVLEINSNDVFELSSRASGSLRNKILYIYDVVTRKKLIRLASGLACVTKELGDSIIKEYIGLIEIIPNSIGFQRFVPIEKVEDNVIQFCFVGTPGQDWHGIDIVEKLAKTLGGGYQFHIIGSTGVDLDFIKYHGYLNEDQLQNILSKMHIGVGSLALGRKKMLEACPLKTREYVVHGLPFIFGYKESAFISETPDWALQLPPDGCFLKNPEYIEKIKEFANTWKMKNIPEDEAKYYFSSSEMEKRRLSFFEKVVVSE